MPEGELQAAPAVMLDSILDATGSKTPEERAYNRDIVTAFLEEITKGKTVEGSVLTTLDARIAEIDTLLSAQLSEIMHDPGFQRLEASWRGLKYLVDNSELSENLRIKVFNVTKKELLRDFKNAPDYDRSQMWQRIVYEEYEQAGGQPFACLIGDFEFSRGNQDIFLLEQMSHVAAGAHAPFLAAAAADMLGFDDFTELHQPVSLAALFDAAEYRPWKSFRQSEDSRYVGLTLPRVLGRLPYGREHEPVEEFNFEEDVTGKDHSKYLWTNAAYALGTRLTEAFANYGWCAAIRGREGGGMVQGLPTHVFKTDAGDVVAKCPTEIPIPDPRWNELTELGFIPLCHYKDTDFAVFFTTQSCQKPVTSYSSAAANANARLSAQLQYIFAVSRIAHFLKAMMKDKIGSAELSTAGQISNYLNNWISQYVLLDDGASQERKAEMPLREARVDVEPIPGKPGAYRAIAYLKPHFQLEELSVAMRLVADLPQGKAA